MFASFHSKGTIPSCSDILNTCASGVLICSTVSFSILGDIPSTPLAHHYRGIRVNNGKLSFDVRFDHNDCYNCSTHFRHWYSWSPIGAREWADPKSTYLTKDPHWVLATTPKRGDIAALDGHVGVVVDTNPGTTVSANKDRVVKNDWGFRKGQKPTFWRYKP